MRAAPTARETYVDSRVALASARAGAWDGSRARLERQRLSSNHRKKYRDDLRLYVSTPAPSSGRHGWRCSVRAASWAGTSRRRRSGCGNSRRVQGRGGCQTCAAARRPDGGDDRRLPGRSRPPPTPVPIGDADSPPSRRYTSAPDGLTFRPVTQPDRFDRFRSRS